MASGASKKTKAPQSGGGEKEVAARKTQVAQVARKTRKTAAARKKTAVTRTARKKTENIYAGTSFKMYERKGFLRELNVPGMMYHILYTFKMLGVNLRVFGPFLIIMVAAGAFLLGLINESTLRDAGALVIVTIMIITIWLTTIFTLRHKMAGQKVKLADALFNAMTPLNAVLVLLALAAVQTVPVMLVIVAHGSAVETHFLETPFYAGLFLVFAALMLLLSGYLLSSTVMAMVAVSAPGIYPVQAIKAASEIMMGRRIKFILRLLTLLVVLVLMWAVVAWPMAIWAPGTWVLNVILMAMGCFSVMYVAAYFYLYYRWILKFDEEEK